MIKKRNFLFASLIVTTANFSWAQAFNKEQAIEQALGAHPGTVEKAYQETKKGVLVWEVKIQGNDDHIWKTYYRADDGTLFMEKKDDVIVGPKDS